MNPFWNVIIGGTIAICALIAAGIKLGGPANPWHRRIGWFTGLLSVVILLTMFKRLHDYQQNLSWWSRGHVLLGLITSVFFVAKIASSRKWYLSPKHLRPFGIALAILFPLTTFGLALPFIGHAAAWKRLLATEVIHTPNQTAFDRSCASCHSRETAADGLGRRTTQSWIDMVEPMAWAGGLGREETRGSLAALLEIPSSETIRLGAQGGDPVDRFCLSCHTKQRTLEAQKTPVQWQETVVRMQGYAAKKPDVIPISDEAAAAVVAWVTRAKGSSTP